MLAETEVLENIELEEQAALTADSRPTSVEESPTLSGPEEKEPDEDPPVLAHATRPATPDSEPEVVDDLQTPPPTASAKEEEPQPGGEKPPAGPEPEVWAVCGDAPLRPPYEDIAVCPILTEWSGKFPKAITACVFAAWTT